MILRNFFIRLCIRRNLIFFACLLLFCCTEKSSEIKILWTDERATGLSIPKTRITNTSENPVVRLITKQEPVAILGDYRDENNEIIFEPLVPFTRGLRYEILVNRLPIGEIHIPEADSSSRPALVNIYPTSDTVPENLLKVYLRFSKPMRESVSAEHITLLQNNQDTIKGAFLDLQPELWNTDRTLLTVWLDPGRIKRDLIPNKQLGTPLQDGEKYTLIISNRWTDTQGSELTKSVHKEFTVASRDTTSPDPKNWKLHLPKSGTKEFLNIDFRSPLDYSLLLSALHIEDEHGKKISGSWEAGEKEKSAKFISTQKWNAGKYFLKVETRLEDLVGNNVNRLFDEDVSKKKSEGSSAELVSVSFVLK